MESTGENLARGGTAFVDRDDQRASVDRLALVRVLHLDLAESVLHLDDWAAVHKKPGHAPNFFQRAATIVAQIEEQPVDFFLVEAIENFFHIDRATDFSFFKIGIK